MKTIILPGYSPHNKDWAEEIKKKLESKHQVVVHQWKHWPSTNSGSSGRSFSLSGEIEEILSKIGKDKINIIAKSVGVGVAFYLVPQISSLINKLIFCGIASVAGDDKKRLFEKVVDTVGAGNILCIQNEKDKFVKFADAESFYHSVNSKIKVVSKPRADHDYPYPDDFAKFLAK